MDVVDYDKKAEEIINNYPFKVIAKDPTRKVESGINKCEAIFFWREKSRSLRMIGCEHHHVSCQGSMEGGKYIRRARHYVRSN